MHIYMNNRFSTRVQRQWNGEMILFSTNGARTYVKKKTPNLDPCLILYTKIKMDQDVNTNLRITKISGMNIGENICNRGLGKNLLNNGPKTQPIKE